MFQEIRDTLRSLSLGATQLRIFGIVGFCITAVAVWRFGYFLPALSPFAVWFIVGIVAPRLLFPLYYFLMACTLPIGWLLSRALLILFFFSIVTPIALLRRLAGRDALHLRFQGKRTDTYWEDIEENTHYDKMYS